MKEQLSSSLVNVVILGHEIEKNKNYFSDFESMSVIRFITGCSHGFLKRRKDITTHVIDIFFDTLQDLLIHDEKSISVQGSDFKKCLMYEKGEDEIILVFPLVHDPYHVVLHRLQKSDPEFQFGEYTHDPEYGNPCPTTCFPPVKEMSDVTLADYLMEDISDDEYLESVELSTMVTQKLIPSYTYADIVISKMVEFGRKNNDDMFRSMVNFTVGEKGIYPKPFPGNINIECTHFDLQSRMMLLNEKEHMNYRYFLSCLKMEKIIAEYDSNQRIYLENHISDIIHVNLLCMIVVVDGGSVWHFHNGKWNEDMSGSHLWNILSSDFQQFLDNESSQNIMKEVSRYLGSVMVRSRILKDLQYKLYDKTFLEKLDTRTDVIGMENKVFDFNINGVRKALPGDYISMMCKGLSTQRWKMEELDNILKTIFPDPSVKKFFLRSCASVLEGYNRYKVFYIWKGNGNNAKSLMQRLMSASLGDYYSVAPTSLITRKRGASSSATPELSFLEGRLAVFLQEPNPDEKIQVGQIKELTGNDHVYVRKLYKCPKKMKVKAKFFIVTNKVVDAPNMDLAFRRRLIVIPFESMFLTVEEYERRIDKNDCYIVNPEMEKNILQYAGAFMSMMIDEYKAFQIHGLEIPQSIKQTTDDYIISNNHPLRFIKEYLIYEEGSSEPVKNVYAEFKEWFKSTMPMKDVIDMMEFLREVELEGLSIRGEYIEDVSMTYT